MINDLILKISKMYIAQDIKKRYKNGGVVNGFILQKPKFTVNPNTNRESCSFILHQVDDRTFSGKILDKTFNVLTFVQPLIEHMRTVDKVSFIECDYVLVWNTKLKSYCPQVYDLRIAAITEEPLEPEYEVKEKWKV